MKIFNYTELDSSQNKARELLKSNTPPFVVIAQTQKKGKGTKSRSWFSPKGGLYFTLAMQLQVNVLELDMVKYSEQLCLKVVEILRESVLLLPEAKLHSNQFQEKELCIKPINDLYYKDAKLAGVLLETINNQEKSILLVGIGLNLKKIDESNLDRKVTSLEEIFGEFDLDKHDFIRTLAQNLNRNIN